MFCASDGILLFPLVIGGDNLADADIFIPVPRLRIFLRHRQTDSLIGTCMNAGQAGLTSAGNMHGPALLQPNGIGRTDLRADAAAYADICHPD